MKNHLEALYEGLVKKTNPLIHPNATILQKQKLGIPVVPFYSFYLGVSLLKLNSTIIMRGLLGNLGNTMFGLSSSGLDIKDSKARGPSGGSDHKDWNTVAR